MLRCVLTKTVWAAALLGVLSTTGCYGTFHEIVDPCYPERYNCKAREAVHNLSAAQVQNGLMYEQTMFVHHFNPAESSLNAGGVAHLQRLANRRPAPESTIYLQTAQNSYDLDYKKPEEYANKRKELDEKRKVAIEAYLKSERPDVTFTVVLSNPAKVGLSGAEGNASIRNVRGTSRGYFMIPGFQDSGGGGN
ncbi:MAG TPA: hypothetical protein PLX97_01165 [Gemmatales bacterium]|nr:hypothetical protein [Gemmatales bacterium]